MNLCSDCLTYEIPECVVLLTFEFDAIEVATDYLIEFTNLFGSKQVITVESLYSNTVVVDVAADLPQGYFFRDNYYSVKIFTSEEMRQCDTPIELCENLTCINLKVKDISGLDLENVTLECC